MTARQVFEATLIELSKLQAPSLKLYEFNYLFNKAINNYINKVYNIYDYNQQTTDDLRVLKATAYLTPTKFLLNSSVANSALHNNGVNASSYLSTQHRSILSLHGATYEAQMPIDYLHLLNCICIYYVAKQKDCWDAGSYIEVPATRLTADSWSQIITDIYNRPSPMKPYYYIHNLNSSNNNAINQNLPTNPMSSVLGAGMPNGTDMSGMYKVTTNGYTKIVVTTGSTTKNYYNVNGLIYEDPSSGAFNYANPGQALSGADLTNALAAILSENAVSTVIYPNPEDTVALASGNNDNISAGSNFPRTFKLDLSGNGEPETNVSLVEKPIAIRAGNTSNVRLEIRYGKLS